METTIKTKKRIRPSLTQVRELERKLAEQTEALHERCQEADGWRENNRNLLFQKRMLERELKETRETNAYHRRLVEALDKQNDHLLREIQHLEDARVLLAKENERLINRNWWQRLWHMY